MTNVEKGVVLLNARKELGWTQEKMARALDIDRSWLLQLEKGRRKVDDYYVERANILLSGERAGVGMGDRLKEGAVTYRIKGEGGAASATEVESAGDVLSAGAISTLNHLVEKMDDDQVADEVCTILKKKKTKTRFEMARYLIKELERRERAGKGTNGH